MVRGIVGGPYTATTARKALVCQVRSLFFYAFITFSFSAVVGKCDLAWWVVALALALLGLLVVGAIVWLKFYLLRARSRGRNKALLEEF